MEEPKCKDRIDEVMLESLESMLGQGELKRLNEFLDATNKFSGIVLKKAELADDFNRVYGNALKKLLEFDLLEPDGGQVGSEFFLRILGETGG
jgi:hypothetical protein